MGKQLVWTDELVKRFWDNQSNAGAVYFTERYAPNILRIAKPYLPEGSSVLDFGAGRGFLAEKCVQSGFTTCAFDYSPESIKDLTAKLGAYEKFDRVYSYEEITQEQNKFDVIFLIEVIEHLDDTHLADVLNTIKTLLRPQGRLFITTPFAEDLAKKQVYCPQCDCFFHNRQHIRSWNVETITHTLTEHGFNVLQCEGTNFTYYEKPMPELTIALKKKLYAILGKEFKAPHMYAVAQKA